MKTPHLSDREIQAFAFDPAECGPETLAHMQSCALCKSQAASYRTIAGAIHEEEAPAFDFDLTALVMDQLPAPAQQQKGIKALVYSLVFLGLALVAFPIYFFLDSLTNLFNQLPAVSNYFILSVAGLIFLPLLWDMYRSFRKKAKMLEFS